jgi:hypothetical protein
MARHFDLIGCAAPNLDGEIHLEPMHVKEVHEEYKETMLDAGIPIVGANTFSSIWYHCFEHVKIREFKAVSGKCQCCANLSSMRKTFKSQRDREYVTLMHSLHRTTYMGERLSYADRRNSAIMEASQYMSTIADGMQQGHNMLPHFANQNVWNDGLPQHLQGVLNHGRGLTIYRTFHNVNNCANVAMYCFLHELEKYRQKEGKLPDTLYHQIDGGSENTAKAWFGLCELLVARRLCKRFVLTRLPVGHTHEDIDSKFGILWRKIRNKHVYSPLQYRNRIVKALSSARHLCEVVDVFAVPDFKSLLDRYIDTAFVPQVKKEKSQLQWNFEAVTPDMYFPNGVRVFYRAFAAEQVFEIINDKTKQCNCHAKRCDVFDYPMKDVKSGIHVDGMHILRDLPSEQPKPYQYVQGGREQLDNLLVKIKQEFSQTHSEIVKQWHEWAEHEAPSSDSVEDYLRDKPLHVPLGDILFSDKPIDTAVVEPWGTGGVMAKLQCMRTTDCVKWARWGHKRDDHSVENFARVEYSGDGAERLLQNALPEKEHVFRRWKARQKLQDDEVGDFHFVLGRKDKRSLSSPFEREGQMVSLVNGGHRVYWRGGRKEHFIAKDKDTGFHALRLLGFYCYGHLVSNDTGTDGVVRTDNPPPSAVDVAFTVTDEPPAVVVVNAPAHPTNDADVGAHEEDTAEEQNDDSAPMVTADEEPPPSVDVAVTVTVTEPLVVAENTTAHPTNDADVGAHEEDTAKEQNDDSAPMVTADEEPPPSVDVAVTVTEPLVVAENTTAQRPPAVTTRKSGKRKRSSGRKKMQSEGRKSHTTTVVILTSTEAQEQDDAWYAAGNVNSSNIVTGKRKRSRNNMFD